MITNLHIENFKSIENMDLPLGSLNILIGENGCGKTNILEAAGIGVAAAKDRLDNEYFFPRGLRKTENRFMKSAFDAEKKQEPIILRFTLDSGENVDFRINENAKGQLADFNGVDFDRFYQREFLQTKQYGYWEWRSKRLKVSKLDFLLYAPENTFLRKFEEEQMEGLGYRGEGLFDELQKIENFAALYDAEKYGIELEKLNIELEQSNIELKKLNIDGDRLILELSGQTADKTDDIAKWKMEYDRSNVDNQKLKAKIQNLENQKAAFEQLPKIKEHLRELLDWFEDFQITGSNMERKLYIKDRFLPEATLFDQRSANEGFLLLLFYLTLFTGAETPAFFAIDNIDTGLNPKLGSRLIEILAKLAKEHNKQAIITTHNPAILDGLDLGDEAQRLFVVKRNPAGKTSINRILPNAEDEDDPIPLSEQFLRGYIGGLPLNF